MVDKTKLRQYACAMKTISGITFITNE